MKSIFRSHARFNAKIGAFFLATAALMGTSVATATDLTIEVTGAKSASGKVRFGLYNDPQAFPRTPWRGLETAATTTGVMTVTFKDLPAGAYAVSAYHDENDNDKLDRGAFEVPLERVGFSRDARGDKGPPEFRDAKIDLTDTAQKITFKMN